MDPETRSEIKHVEETLQEIRNNTAVPWWRAILNGLMYGGGAVIGTVLAIFLLGWILSVFGVIPGFSEIAHKLQEIVNSKL